MNGKIVRYRCKNFDTYYFKVVKNYRDYKGTPTHKIIKSFGPIHSTDFLKARVSFWREVDTELDRLLVEGTITYNHVQKIKNQFSRFIPRPIAPPAPVILTAEDKRAIRERLGLL